MAVQELFAYLCVRNTAEAIDFYGRAFGAKEKFRLTEPSGRIGHAELDFGGTTLMLCDEFPEYGFAAPQPGTGTSVTIHIHVDNADAVIQRAVEAGATLEIRRPTRSTANARAACAIPSAIGGISGTTSKTSRRTRCSVGIRRCSRLDEHLGVRSRRQLDLAPSTIPRAIRENR